VPNFKAKVPRLAASSDEDEQYNKLIKKPVATVITNDGKLGMTIDTRRFKEDDDSSLSQDDLDKEKRRSRRRRQLVDD